MKIKIISETPPGKMNFPDLPWDDKISADPGNQFCLDLGFDESRERINALESAYPGLIAVNSVSTTLIELPPRFLRFNGWPGFLQGPVIEVAALEGDKETASKAFGLLGKKPEWVKDQPGFISARIVAMIINEAYYALEEKLSSKQEIDTAMKLGTNYPLGPFEWSEAIGLKKLHTLLLKLSGINKRYLPAPLLEKEAV